VRHLRRLDRRRFRYTLPGAWVALVFACLAFTPSLLPRSAVLQGVVCGISAAIGYGVGVAGAWTWRAFADRDLRPPRQGAWRVFAISAVVALVLALAVGQWWQAQLRDLMGAPTPNPLLLVLLPLVAVAIFTGLVALSRSLRGAYHRVAVRLQRWMGRRAARALGWVAVVFGTYCGQRPAAGRAGRPGRPEFSVLTRHRRGRRAAHQHAPVGWPGIVGVQVWEGRLHGRAGAAGWGVHPERPVDRGPVRARVRGRDGPGGVGDEQGASRSARGTGRVRVPRLAHPRAGAVG
jgi:hypothetical protein